MAAESPKPGADWLLYAADEINGSGWLQQLAEEINQDPRLNPEVEYMHGSIVEAGLMILQTQRVMQESFGDENIPEETREYCGWLSTYIGSVIRRYYHDYHAAVEAHFLTNRIKFSFADYTVEALSRLPASFADGIHQLEGVALRDPPLSDWLLQLGLFVDSHQGFTGVRPKDIGLELLYEK